MPDLQPTDWRQRMTVNELNMSGEMMQSKEAIARGNGDKRMSKEQETAMYDQPDSTTDPTREALEEAMWKHQPVISFKDGSIAGCQCSDNVFNRATEDWGMHLADAILASGLVVTTAEADRLPPSAAMRLKLERFIAYTQEGYAPTFSVQEDTAEFVSAVLELFPTTESKADR